MSRAEPQPIQRKVFDVQEPSIVTEPKRDGAYIVVRDGTTLPARWQSATKKRPAAQSRFPLTMAGVAD